MIDSEIVDPSLQMVVQQVRGNPIAMLNVARTLLLPKGHHKIAFDLAAEAVDLASGDPEVQAINRMIRNRGDGEWYFSMVRDADRHRLYERALRRLIVPGCVVLDIGAGTGLFAMIAARAGAALVIACERDLSVARAAQEIVALNGLEDKVRIVAKSSTQLELGVDLPKRADILLWDNLSNNVLGAGALATLDDARHRLIEPSASIIPERAELRVALAEDLRSCDRTMEKIEGFDLSPFNVQSAQAFTIKRENLRRRSDAATMFDFDFNRAQSKPARTRRAVRSTGGHVNGVVQWVRFHLRDGIAYETDGPTVTAFGQQFHQAPAFQAKADQEVIIGGNHDLEHTWFWIEH